MGLAKASRVAAYCSARTLAGTGVLLALLPGLGAVLRQGLAPAALDSELRKTATRHGVDRFAAG